MEKSAIQPRTPLETLIPAWNDLTRARQFQIEKQINQEWWRGYYAGRMAERIETLNATEETGA